MGVFITDTKQYEKKKHLPKKPVQDTADQEPAISEDTFDYDMFVEEACLETSWEEDLWRAVCTTQATVITPEPLAVYHVDVEVNNNLATPDEAVLIAENNNDEKTYSFPEEASEDPKDFWGLDTFDNYNIQHAPAALVEGINSKENEDHLEEIHCSNSNNEIENNASEVDTIVNMDIVQLAIGESGISGLTGHADSGPFWQLDNNTVADKRHKPLYDKIQPMGTTASFIQQTDNLMINKQREISQPPHSPPVYAKKSSPYSLQSKPVMKKKVGRPERTTPLTITRVPSRGEDGLTEELLKDLKWRRMRDLNNEASKKCRENRKMKQSLAEQGCSLLEERNRMLGEKLLTMESQVSLWMEKCKSVGFALSIMGHHSPS